MKFELLRETMIEALAQVAGGVSKRHTLPVLSHVNIMATISEGVRLATTNFDLYLQTAVATAVVEGGGINLPHKLLTDVLARMDGERVSLALNARTDEVTIVSGDSCVILKGIEVDKFSYKMPTITDQTEQFQVTGAWLKERINAVAFSAADDDTRPALRCLRWVFDGKLLTMVAVDGFRLTRWVELLENPLITGQRILHLPVYTLAPIIALLDDTDVVTVTLNCEAVAFETERIRAVMNLADVNFPEYEPVIPTSFSYTLHPAASKLQRACELVLLLAEDKHHPGLRLDYEPGIDVGNLKISAISSAGNGSAICTDVALETDWEKEPESFGVNGRYLIDALAHAPAPIRLKLNQRTDPIALVMATSDREWLHLIMPMHFGR